MVHEEKLPAGGEAAPQDGISRRKLIVTGATLAVAGVAVGAAVPLTASAIRDNSATHDHAAPALDAPLMVHVKDLASGQLDLFVGTRHVSLTDRGMAAQLARAAATAS
ncbi:MAG: hypothetical protein ACJ72N_08700 [Labedaea sp.]